MVVVASFASGPWLRNVTLLRRHARSFSRPGLAFCAAVLSVFGPSFCFHFVGLFPTELCLELRVRKGRRT